MDYDMFNHSISLASRFLEVKKITINHETNKQVDFMNFIIKLHEQNSLPSNLTPPVRASFEMLSPSKEIVCPV